MNNHNRYIVTHSWKSFFHPPIFQLILSRSHGCVCPYKHWKGKKESFCIKSENLNKLRVLLYTSIDTHPREPCKYFISIEEKLKEMRKNKNVSEFLNFPYRCCCYCTAIFPITHSQKIHKNFLFFSHVAVVMLITLFCHHRSQPVSALLCGYVYVHFNVGINW